jgi:methyl-accepting chemotaxis protein
MKPITDTLKALALFAAVFALVELGLLFREATAVVRETKPLIAETDKRLDGTFRNLNAILIQAGLVAARIEDLSRNMGDVASRQGKYWEALQAKTIASLDKLNASADALTALLANTDNGINGRLIPEAAESLDSIKALTKEATADLAETSDRANASLDDIHRLLSDPAWAGSLASIQNTTQHVSGISMELEAASRQIPEIAQSINKIASISSRYRRWILLSQIFSAVARTFF